MSTVAVLAAGAATSGEGPGVAARNAVAIAALPDRHVRLAPSWHDVTVPGPRLAIVDDHPAILAGAASALRAALPDAEIVVSGTAAAALDGVTGQDVDVVVLDVSLGDGSDPPDTVAALVARGLDVLLYTQDTRRGLVSRCFRAGAAGIVPKRADVEVLVEAVLTVAAGRPFLSPEWALALYGDDAWGVPNLAPREQEALRLYAAGLPMKLVARRMDISQETAREYLLRVRRKYAEVGREAGTKTDLYFLAVEDGHLPEGRPDDS